MPFNNINISLEINFIYLFIGIVLISGYTYIIYKYTIPKISNLLKSVLIIIRSLSIIFLLILIFEPIITVWVKKNITPKIYFFIDNSRSIGIKDSSDRKAEIVNAIKNLTRNNYSQSVMYTFGNNLKQIPADSIESINFNEPLTNIEKVISFLENSEDNIAASVLISDGIITDGVNPIYNAEKLDFPLYTVGVGDTSIDRDISIKDVFYNQFIYASKQTEIEVLITNTGFENNTTKISLLEEDKLIQTKNITLGQSGLNKIKFDYTPSKSGEIKLSAVISKLNNEQNVFNNKKDFYINVLKDKIKVALIAGSPSPDLSAISKVLEEDNNIKLEKIVFITDSKIWNQLNLTKLDSSEVIVLIDFPFNQKQDEISKKIFSTIEKNKKPYLLILSQNTDLKHLSTYEKILPFTVNKISKNFIEIEPEIISNSISLIFPKSIEQNEWFNLPPLLISTSEFSPKPGADVLIKGKMRSISSNVSLIISMNISGIKSFVILTSDIWKWQLLLAEKNPSFFSNFITNIIKWLNVSEKQNQFTIRPNKKIFSLGEEIEFLADLYDNTFSPVDSAKIILNVYNENQSFKITMDKIKSGLFNANLIINEKGNYFYNAIAEFSGVKLKSNSGRLSITDLDIEKYNTRMDNILLYQLANNSNGKFYFIDEINLLKKDLSNIYNNALKIKISKTEINLRTNQWFMLIILLFFSIEWFLRKRYGML